VWASSERIVGPRELRAEAVFSEPTSKQCVRRDLNAALVVVSLLIGAGSELHADCYLPSSTEALNREQAALAFDGTVRRIDHFGSGTDRPPLIRHA